MQPESKSLAEKAWPSGEVEAWPVGPHWFVQEADIYDFENNADGELVHTGRYLKVYAHSMVEVNGAIMFFGADRELVMEFPAGSWTFLEHGYEEDDEEKVVMP